MKNRYFEEQIHWVPLTAGKSTVNQNFACVQTSPICTQANQNSAPSSLKSQNPFVQYIKRTKCTYRIGAMKRNFFSVSRLKNFRCPIISTQKGIFPLFQQKNFCYKRPPHYNGYFFFFLREVHTFTLVYNGHFLLSPRWLKEVRQLCSIITSQKRPTRKIFPLFPMVLFLFSPRELIKRPSLGRLN